VACGCGGEGCEGIVSFDVNDRAGGGFGFVCFVFLRPAWCCGVCVCVMFHGILLLSFQLEHVAGALAYL
jgi:hypothetical protein